MTKRGCCAALVAALGTLVAAPMARADTLTVDDNGVECPAAPYTSIQNAIFASRPGDTIVVCPGHYVEGGGGVGTNALIIVSDVNIKGAGADLVTISPKRTTASQSRIAESTSPSIRNAVGDIIMINGDYVPTAIPPNVQSYNKDKSRLLTVNISGVTIDGDGVYAEAGVVYRDAQGTISKSRITNVVTTERSLDVPRPGEYKGSTDGIAVAAVTAPPATIGGVQDTVALPTTPRVVNIDHTRIDKYNSTGVLLDGATGDTAPLTASGVVTKATLLANQIAGRTLCIDFESTGNCSSPQPATNGPLYGQDGVRITAGSSATLTNNTISQNLVQGTGAPTRGSATNNANLTMGAGVRLLGAAASVFSLNNLTDNAYGVYNAQLDGTTANTAVPVKAENNWWGLRTSALAVNPGPAISPATNPAAPENPVNGAPLADGAGTSSDAVDFFPFRNGFQSDPNTGEFPVLDVPGPVNDAAPLVTLDTDQITYHKGAKAKLIASPTDDFGVHSVVFYDGNAIVASSSTKPYTVNYTIPTDVYCGQRTLTAVVEDSAGQTGFASKTIEIDPADCAGSPTPTPTATATATATATPTAVATATATVTVGGEVTATPTPEPRVLAASNLTTISFLNAPKTLKPSGTTISSLPSSTRGIKQVDYYLGNNKLCSAIAAPWSCHARPTGGDVGLQVLRAVVTDLSGATAEASTRVEVLRFSSKGLSVSISSANQSHNRVRKTIRGKLQLPAGVNLAQGCTSGHVTVVMKRSGKTVANSQKTISASCSFSVSAITQRTAKKGAFTVSVRFGGNAVLLPVTASRRFS